MGVLELLFKLWIVFLGSLCLSITDCFTAVFAIPAKQGTRGAVGGPREHQISNDSPKPTTSIAEQHRVNTVSVVCHSDLMEITIKADLFNVGTFVEGEGLRLGVEDGRSCRLTQTSADEYQVAVAITDCGTKHRMTEDALMYTNNLFYTPVTTPDGLIRMNDAVIPIECHYQRKYNLTSGLLTPKWNPFTSSQAAGGTLEFDLQVMTNDWEFPRGSGVFFLGDPISIEASVQVAQHPRLKIFVNSCVATLDSESNSVPKYVFIKNGCLIDSQLPGSRSQFMPGTQKHKLRLQIDAFKFHNADQAEVGSRRLVWVPCLFCQLVKLCGSLIGKVHLLN
ncbi:zona pellucida sperm-binding protein 3-like [Aplochiton taeniatus]